MDDAAQSDGQPHYAPPVYTQQPAASGTPFWEQGGAKQSAKQEKPKSRLTKGGAAVIVALCVLFSAVFGIGGGVLGNYIYAQANPQESTQQSQSASQSDSGMLHTSDSADLSSKTKTLTSVVDFAADSVVEITTEAISMSYYFQQLISTGAGSGVILTETDISSPTTMLSAARARLPSPSKTVKNTPPALSVPILKTTLP